MASSDEPRRSTLWNTLQTGTLLKEVRDGEALDQDLASSEKRIPVFLIVSHL